MEPESKLVANFNADGFTQLIKKYCKYIFQSEPLWELDFELQNLKTYPCNKFTKEESEVVDFSLIIISFEDDKALKKSEFKNVENMIAKLFDYTVKCIWGDLKLDEEDNNKEI